MKTKRNILIAFILNLSFAVFELIGGVVTGSVAIVSDAVHDAGDAASIGVSYFLERKSHTPPNEKYTYGYARHSVLGGFITTLILLLGSLAMLWGAIGRIITPKPINYNGMIIFAVVGVCVNSCAAFFTRGKGSLNQRAVNLHMLEDVLGWLVVLVGAVVMRFTDFALIDPIMCIGVSVFILVSAIRSLKQILQLFLEKAPDNIKVSSLKESVENLEGVIGVHHIHLWSLDGENSLATLHVITDSAPETVKADIKKRLRECGVGHATVEIETSAEHCVETSCDSKMCTRVAHSHHHHHH